MNKSRRAILAGALQFRPRWMSQKKSPTKNRRRGSTDAPDLIENPESGKSGSPDFEEDKSFDDKWEHSGERQYEKGVIHQDEAEESN